jgi:hypothetical protein
MGTHPHRIETVKTDAVLPQALWASDDVDCAKALVLLGVSFPLAAAADSHIQGR